MKSKCFVYIFILLAVMLSTSTTVHVKTYPNFSLILNYQILYCFNIIYIADTAWHLHNLSQYVHAFR